MRKKTIVIAVTLTFMLGIAFTQVALADPPEKQVENKQTSSHSSPPKKAEAESDVEEGHKVPICHSGHIISVDVNALPGHGINDLIEGQATTTEENSSGGVRGSKKH